MSSTEIGLFQRCGGALADVLKPCGHLLHYGLLSGQPLPADQRRRRPDIRIELFWLRRWVHGRPRQVVADRMAQVARLARDGILDSPIEATFPLSALPAALGNALRPDRSGKTLIRC